MNLHTTIEIYATAAGSQATGPGDNADMADARLGRYLYRKQTRLNKTRKRGMPYPGGAFEDKKQVGAKIPVQAEGRMFTPNVKRTFTIQATPEMMDRFEAMIRSIETNCNVGHSCTVAVPVDGDGADRFRVVSGLDAKGKVSVRTGRGPYEIAELK